MSSQPASSPATPDTTTDTIKRTALIVCLVSSFVNPFAGASLNIALPSMAAELHMNAPLVPWVLTIFMLASTIFMLPLGRLADIYGRKKMFIVGWALFSVTTLAVSFSVNATMLLTLRVFMGIAAAGFFGASVAILTSVFPAKDRGRVLGMSVAAQYGGNSLGPVLGGILTQQWGWRSIFWLMVPISAIMTVVVATRLKGEWADARGEKFDAAGSVIYGISLMMIMFGVSQLPNVFAIAPIVLGLCVLSFFAWWESRTKAPVLDIRLFKGNIVFTLANIAALINFSASMATALLISLYLQNVKGFTPQAAGLLMIAQPLVQALLSTKTGDLSSRMDPHRLSALGMGLTALALFLFSRLSADSPIWVVVAILMIMGTGFAFFASPNMNVVMGAVERKYYGVASAIVNTMRQGGQMISSGISATIFAVLIGQVLISPAIAPQLMHSINITFTVFSVLCLVGITFALAGSFVSGRGANVDEDRLLLGSLPPQ